MRLTFSKKERPITLTQYLILRSLKGGKEVYGGELMHNINRASSASYSPINLSVGSFYLDLKSLRKKGLILSRDGEAIADGARRQYYFLTDEGREVVQQVESLFGLI